jgi:hypothetical protein
MVTSPLAIGLIGGQAIALDAVADDAELAHLLDQRPGELGVLPVAVDDR